ncbi:ferric reductase-like transmembrane domain-containing protein [Azonexus sp.]|uniref:ferredoxin reductase family protein n=1 Tax=Azonexus sp. TaxID=1872668 RepID=UPI0035AE8693
MKKILIALALVPFGLWGVAALPELLAGAPGFWNWRRALITGSGILSLWWMSGAIVLAVRPAWLERALGGLDRLYKIHKTIGITTGCLVFAHWMLEWLPKNLARQGWIEAPRRGPRPPEEWWLGLAKDAGEWAGYLLLGLVVIALVRRIPYRYFRLVHKAFGLLFMVGAFHGLVLLPTDFWQQPVGWASAAVAALGVIAALWSLAGRIGRNRRHPARVESVDHHPDNVIRVRCRPLAGWPGHRGGQFVLANFGDIAEGPHPFTISSGWNADDGTLTLAIKALGDYTGKLTQSLQAGHIVTLEGPYGNFTFDSQRSATSQVWIAGGIGITPFLARLSELAESDRNEAGAVDLFYSTRTEEAGFPEELPALCAAAGVRLHHRVTARDGQLGVDEIAACLPADGGIWFCGPAAWGRALGKQLQEIGAAASGFHAEAFEFR